MSLTNYMGEAKRAKRRPAGFAMSLAMHGAAFLALTNAPEVKLPPTAPSEYEQAIEGHEPKLVWYRFNKDLPDVTPPSAKAQKKPLQALNVAKQQIVASPKDAPQRTQFVWTPAPELPDVTPLESPNLLAVRLPEPKPERKPFVTPPDIQRPVAQVETPPDAPVLEAKALPTAAVPAPQKLVKQFVEPAKAQPKEMPKVEAAPDAPALEARALAPAAVPRPERLVKQFVAPPKKVPVKVAEIAPAPQAPALEARALRTAAMPAPERLVKQFVAPPKSGAVKGVKVAAAPEAPQLTASPAPAAEGALEFRVKDPARPFTAPPAQSAAAALPVLPDTLLADLKDLNVAVVGLHPTDLAAMLPGAASPAKFSASPQIRKNGAETAGDATGVSVPDLFVRGAKAARPDLIAQVYAAPTSAENLRAAQKATGSKAIVARLTGDTDVPLTERTQAAMKVSGSPDPRFNGRDVYMMAIQMPNLTSYSGSWLMWYADRTAREAGLAPVAPPVPHRKVDPKYVAAAQAERVEGKVQLACVIDREGRVSSIELVRGLDARLNQTAQEALAKWEFTPAMRDGMAVDVDVLVEIPFRLAPGKAISY